jgi:hypothetical protein
VKTRKSQSTESDVRISRIGFNEGTTMSRKRCQGPAPSIAAASIISSGICVSPAYRVNATNGKPIQTTMIVATK